MNKDPLEKLWLWATWWLNCCIINNITWEFTCCTGFTPWRFLQVFLLKRKLLLKGVGVTSAWRCRRDGWAPWGMSAAYRDEQVHRFSVSCCLRRENFTGETVRDTAHISSELAKYHPHMVLRQKILVHGIPRLPVSVPCLLGSPACSSGLHWSWFWASVVSVTWPKGANILDAIFFFPAVLKLFTSGSLGFSSLIENFLR